MLVISTAPSAEKSRWLIALSPRGIGSLVMMPIAGQFTNRFDPRKLLAVYYGLRGLSLFYLPYSGFSAASLTIFAVVYGLDWIATVPPTLRLSNEAFGDRSGPLVFGWVVAGHQVGAAAAAFFGGATQRCGLPAGPLSR